VSRTVKEFTLALKGNTIARPTVAVMMALDQSASMDDPAGTTGARRVEVLREAASHFVDVVQPNNCVGIVRFDTDGLLPMACATASTSMPSRTSEWTPSSNSQAFNPVRP
jgi:hypothetical protein